MIKVNSKNKVYILCTYEKTGGPRSLHQLGFYLQDRGVDVNLFYCNQRKHLKYDRVLYDDFDLKQTDEIEDNLESIIIIPETLTNWRHKFSKAKVLIWWLSLDYYRVNELSWAASWGRKRFQMGKSMYVFFYIWYMLKRIMNHNASKKYMLSKEEFKDSYHLYNCEYINNYLKKMSVPCEFSHYLCGPIEEFFETVIYEDVRKRKENIVVYNPAKVNKNYMNKIVKKINEKGSKISVIPVKNMTRIEVINILGKAKVYADLGYFPGPERMPRESACLFCNLITSTLGSAGDNERDIPIPLKFEFNVTRENVALISTKIIELVDDYENYVKEYDEYRIKVKKQIASFENDINEIFELSI